MYCTSQNLWPLPSHYLTCGKKCASCLFLNYSYLIAVFLGKIQRNNKEERFYDYIYHRGRLCEGSFPKGSLPFMFPCSIYRNPTRMKWAFHPGESVVPPLWNSSSTQVGQYTYTGANSTFNSYFGLLTHSSSYCEWNCQPVNYNISWSWLNFILLEPLIRI